MRQVRRWSLLLALLVLLGVPSVSKAFTYWVNYANSYNYFYPNGTVGRVAEMGGTYQRSNKQESMWFVRIVALDKNQKFLAGSKANFDKPSQTWRGSTGHYAMAYYYAEFNIHTAKGDVVLNSPIYRWRP